ncbi:hypothetical protein B0T19DRAFT_477768 [Cercophora scortea]|uniref:DUF6594 domain-containing protein n=1 Tax=Cercophora scortea TaxID=314031 RepID=A0AAE0IA56_9PEZI|nr:hypothetical protein B0T19DRAFT_477768 [Cercophora scortea]
MNTDSHVPAGDPPTSSPNDHDDSVSVQGYAKLVKLITTSPGIAIFRKFSSLNLLNLLRLQAELHDLEYQLEEARGEDNSAVDDPNRPHYRSSFRTMIRNAEDGDSVQYELLLEIGKKLEQYNTALQNVLSLESTVKPTAENLKFLRMWLVGPADSFGNDFLRHAGVEQSVWDEPNEDDLITMQAPKPDESSFSQLLNEKLIDIYHGVIVRFSKNTNKAKDGKIRAYDTTKFARVGAGIVAALSALLPTTAILVLYYVNSMAQRIGLVVLFTSFFSIALAIFTKAKPIEMLSATAAFAAVEVVYIGSASTSS